MRPLLLALVTSLIALFTAPTAQAGTLTSATWFQVAQGAPMTRTTAQLGATGTSTATSISVGLSYPATQFSFFLLTPGGLRDLKLTLAQGGPDAITATPSMASATQGVPGTVVVMTAGHLGMGVNASMYISLPGTVVRLPIVHGRSGHYSATENTLRGIPFSAFLDFYAWTPRTVTFTGLTSDFALLPDVVAMGSFDLSPQGGGSVTLVSPARLWIDGSSLQRRTVSVTTLRLAFVPEPAALLLFAFGLALAWLRQRRA